MSTRPTQDQRILVVDDEPRNQTLLQDYLQVLGLSCDLASDGVECLTRMEETDYDLVLLDIMMPNMDGFEVLSRIGKSSRHRDVQVVVISASDETEAAARAIGMGAIDYLRKPFSHKILKARVAACLERKRLIENEKVIRQRERENHQLLREAYERLARTENARDNLNHMIIHDLNSPIGAVINYAELIQAQVESNQPNLDEIGRIAEQAILASEGMLNLTAAILDVSKLESGKIKVDPELVDLGQVAQQIYERSKEGAQSHGVRIDLELPSNHANTVVADRHLVSRVIDNLVSNSLKFAETTAAIRLDRPDPQQVVLEVINDGEPIPSSARTCVFEKYFQIDRAGSERTPRRGLGLGLAFCRMAVEAMQGRIWTDNGKDGLTHFYVSLPSSRE